jgi:hypothetical protein
MALAVCALGPPDARFRGSILGAVVILESRGGPILQVVLWALVSGGITGGVWMAIVLFDRQKRLTRENAELLRDRQRALDALEDLTGRVAELEDRLEFTERVLTEPPDRTKLPPAS